jgi:transcriptional regulator with XRE-family HTH domain
MSVVTHNLPVGPELREAREACGLSRERLARLADCSYARVAQLELGMRPAHSPALARIWRVLDALRDDRAGGGDA